MIKNLTSNDISVFSEDGVLIKTYPSETTAKVKQRVIGTNYIDEVPVYKTDFETISELPDYKENVYYIVSVTVAHVAKAKGRKTDDLLLVINPVRNTKGELIGCKSFTTI